ncbi:MAG: hypothetical protein DIU71_18820, partial [Proteobacteria bacterium]
VLPPPASLGPAENANRLSHALFRRCAITTAITSTLALFGALAPLSARADASAQTAAEESALTEDDTMVRLIRSLIRSGALDQDVGEALLAQALTDAMVARQAGSADAADAAQDANPVRAQPGDVRVPYIPETVRDEIRADLRDEIMAQAQAEGWAAPNETPGWARRIRVAADMRLRNETRMFSGDNSTIEVDWAAINAGDPYDVNVNTNLPLPPLRNTREDRENLLRVRARFGIHADISTRVRAGIRMGTGNDDSPASTNQSFGGGLRKKDIWLDQAWVSYDILNWLTVTGGRFDQPFLTTDILFSDDLNVDGLAVELGDADSPRRFSAFGTLGAIPLEYFPDSFPGRSQEKMKSEDKWLFAAQLGAAWRPSERQRLRAAVAWYDFQNITGQRSEPCALYAGDLECSTDWSRPAFMQKGNTLMLLRDIERYPLDPANTPLPQYVGLASEFELVDVNVHWDARLGRYGLRLDLNYLRSLEFDAEEIWTRAAGNIVNNFGGAGGTALAEFESGGEAYML